MGVQVIQYGQVLWSQKKRLISFDELTLERERQRVFLFDADDAKERCLTDTLRADFDRFWLAYAKGTIDQDGWIMLRKRFAEHNLFLPSYPNEVSEFRVLLDTLYTAKEGKPVGWRYADIVKVAHHVEDRHKGFLWAFTLMLKAHERGTQILAEDTTKNWRSKVKRYRAAWGSSGDTNFQPDRKFDSIIAFLFPEISKELKQKPN